MREGVENKEMGSLEEVRKLVKVENLGPNVKVLPTNDQIKELLTILRDKYVCGPICLVMKILINICIFLFLIETRPEAILSFMQTDW